MLALALFAVILFVPSCEIVQAFADGDGRGEAVVALEGFGVGVGDGDVARLHADELAVGREVIVRGEDAGADQFLLQGGDEVHQVLRLAAADVVDRVGREGKSVLSRFLFGRALHDADDALEDVVDVGEVALAVAVVEDPDRAALGEGLGGGVVEHVRPAGGAVDGEEAQAGGRDAVQLAVAVGEELVGLLGGGVEGDGVVHLVVHGEGHLFVPAVDGGAGGVDQVLDRVVAAGLEDVVEADDVRLDVDVGVVDGVAHAGLGGEVHDDGGAVLAEDLLDMAAVGEVAFNEDVLYGGLLCLLLDQAEAVFLQLRVVVVVHGVEGENGAAGELLQEADHQVGPDEARGAGDEDGLVVQVDRYFAHTVSSFCVMPA